MQKEFFKFHIWRICVIHSLIFSFSIFFLLFLNTNKKKNIQFSKSWEFSISFTEHRTFTRWMSRGERGNLWMIHPADCLRYSSVFFLNWFLFYSSCEYFLPLALSSLIFAFSTLRKSFHFLQQKSQKPNKSKKAPNILIDE